VGGSKREKFEERELRGEKGGGFMAAKKVKSAPDGGGTTPVKRTEFGRREKTGF